MQFAGLRVSPCPARASRTGHFQPLSSSQTEAPHPPADPCPSLSPGAGGLSLTTFVSLPVLGSPSTWPPHVPFTSGFSRRVFQVDLCCRRHQISSFLRGSQSPLWCADATSGLSSVDTWVVSGRPGVCHSAEPTPEAGCWQPPPLSPWGPSPVEASPPTHTHSHTLMLGPGGPGETGGSPRLCPVVWVPASPGPRVGSTEAGLLRLPQPPGCRFSPRGLAQLLCHPTRCSGICDNAAENVLEGDCQPFQHCCQVPLGHPCLHLPQPRGALKVPSPHNAQTCVNTAELRVPEQTCPLCLFPAV